MADRVYVNASEMEVEVIIAFINAMTQGQTERRRGGTEACHWKVPQLTTHYTTCLCSTPYFPV